MSQKYLNISRKFNKLKRLSKNIKELFKNQSRGAILIIAVIVIPILLLGTKLALDSRTKNEVYQQVGTTGTSNYTKRCAKEAALAVAQNWNPGLTLGQQKEGVYKVADAVYNANPCFTKSVIGQAIPGLDVKTKYKVKNNSTFGPMDVSYSMTSHSDIMAQKTVNYSNETKYLCRWTSYCYASSSYGWNRYYGMWLGIDKASNSVNRRSMFDEIDQTKINNAEYVLQQHEICLEPHVYGCKVYNAPTDTDYDNGWHEVRYNMPSTSTSYSGLSGYCFYTNLNSYKANSSYTLRTDSLSSTLSTTTYSKRSTGSDANYVQVSIASDSTNGGKIKVQTDSDIGYAVPASCNVDIVLAVPVNSAACNENGRDLASDTAENPLSYSGSEALPAAVKNTPIYQMGQACKNFVKDNFYHTRGIHMSLIPYSGKLSISPDRALDWTVSIPQFDDSSINTQVMIGACLYGTQGQKDAKLKRNNITTTIKTGTTISAPYYWGGLQHGCPIMCRQGSCNQYSRYGNNYAANGMLMSTSNPGDSNIYLYRRMNLNPCYMGYANTLAMKCEETCRYYSANPYYIIEPTSDLVKIYEMCNALTPVYDAQNVSNFVFLPLEWANNFFQSWTRNETVSTAVTGTSNTATLTYPSKTTSGRKKAIILLVNKPDWFEPGELTYLGFDNDAAEIPTIESDKIDFSIDYSDTSKKFLDGTSYDGTIQGPKKILKFSTQSGTAPTKRKSSNHYETASATCRLSFPRKGLLKITVAPSYSRSISWSQYSCNLSSLRSHPWYNMGRMGVGGPIGGKYGFLAQDSYGDLAYSADGKSWTDLNILGGDGWYLGFVYGNGWWVQINALDRDTGVQMCKDPVDESSWVLYTNRAMASQAGFAFGNGIFMLVSSSDSMSVWTASAPTNLTKVGTCPCYARVLGYGNGRWIASDGNTYYSTDNGVTWNFADATLNDVHNSAAYRVEWYGSAFAYNMFYVVNSRSHAVARSFDGTNWEEVTALSCGNSHRNVTLYNDHLYIFGQEGTCCHIGTFKNSSIQFSNISAKTGGTTLNKTTISDTTTFYIDASQMSNSQINGNYYVDFSMVDIQLISAEITNQAYDEVQAECYLEGTTNALGTSGTAYILTNCKEKMTLRAKSSRGSVTFYGDNRATGKAENVGTYSFPSERIFIFSGPKNFLDLVHDTKTLGDISTTGGYNFGHNLSVKKVRFSLDHAEISNMILSNQILRYYPHYGYANDQLGSLILNDSGNCAWDMYKLKVFDPCIELGPFYDVDDGWIFYSEGDDNYQLRIYNLHPICHGMQRGKFILCGCSMADGDKGDRNLTCLCKQNGGGEYWSEIGPILDKSCNRYGVYTIPPASGGYTSYYSDKIQVFTGRVHDSSGNPARYHCNGFFFVNEEPKIISNPNNYKITSESHVDLLKNKGVYILNNEWICFCGDAQLAVTVKHTGTQNGTLKYIRADTGETTTVNISSGEEYVNITIDPAVYQYERDPYGYRIKLTLNNVSIDNLKFVSNPRNVCRLKELTNRDNTRIINYKGTTISYNSVLMNLSSSTFYDSGSGYQSISKKSGKSYVRYVSPKLVMGDISHLMTDYGPEGACCSISLGSNYTLSNYSIPGMIRLFSPMWRENLTYRYLSCTETSTAGAINLYATDATWPMNLVLNRNGYQPSVDTTPSAAVSAVTSAACAKLKTDYGANLRIYVIKYRKQEKYKSFPLYNTTQTDIAHDYTTVDACASSTSYLYDVSTEDDLKTKLNQIAANIKSWAGYTKAKNVD